MYIYNETGVWGAISNFGWEKNRTRTFSELIHLDFGNSYRKRQYRRSLHFTNIINSTYVCLLMCWIFFSDRFAIKKNKEFVSLVSVQSSAWNTGRRVKLPAMEADTSGVNLWNLLCRNIGKDLSKISMPVTLNEPLSVLQRLCEELVSFSSLLLRSMLQNFWHCNNKISFQMFEIRTSETSNLPYKSLNRELL